MKFCIFAPCKSTKLIKMNQPQTSNEHIKWKVPLFLAILFLVASLTATANDGIYYMTGNHLVPLTETEVEVHKEVLTISLLDDGYALVDVQYQFFNPTSTTKRVLMGFEAAPPYNDWKYSYKSSTHPYLRDFTVEMNGRNLNYNSAICSSFGYPLEPIDTTKRYYPFYDVLYEEGTGPDYDIEGDWTSFTYVYYFDAEFLPGMNNVHHTYAYKLSVINVIPYYLNYLLEPAARWANGQIDDFTLIIRAQNTAKHFRVNPFCDNGTFSVIEGTGKIRNSKNTYDNLSTEVTLRNGAIAMHIPNFVPDSDKALEIYSAINLEDIYGDGPRPIGLSYDRSSANEIEELEASQNADDYVLSDSAFLVRVVHNLPYAHRGYVFKNERLRHFFESQWWYMPDPNYHPTDEDFTTVDRRYVTFHFGKTPTVSKSVIINYDMSEGEVNKMLTSYRLPFHYSKKTYGDSVWNESLHFNDTLEVWKEENGQTYIYRLFELDTNQKSIYQINFREDVVGCERVILVIPGDGIYDSDIFNCDSKAYHLEDYVLTSPKKECTMSYDEPSNSSRTETLIFKLVKKL